MESLDVTRLLDGGATLVLAVAVLHELRALRKLADSALVKLLGGAIDDRSQS